MMKSFAPSAPVPLDGLLPVLDWGGAEISTENLRERRLPQLCGTRATVDNVCVVCEHILCVHPRDQMRPRLRIRSGN